MSHLLLAILLSPTLLVSLLSVFLGHFLSRYKQQQSILAGGRDITDAEAHFQLRVLTAHCMPYCKSKTARRTLDSRAL